MKHTQHRPALLCTLSITVLLTMLPLRAASAQQPGQPESNDPATAQTNTVPSASELTNIQIDPRLRRLVRQLDDPIYETRHTATVQLREMDIDRKQFYALLEEQTLTVEQRHRLVDIVRYRLLHAPRGALGISMMSGNLAGNPNSGVRVTGLVPGMPAERVLKRQDRITHIDGKAIESADQLVDLVQGKRPGDTIQLTIERNGETTDVELVLGSTRTIEQREASGGGPLRVSETRRREARHVLSRFAPQPRRVPIVPWSPGS